MGTADFLRFADCFTEPLLMVSRDGRLLAANAAGRVLLGLIEPVTGEPPLTEFVTDSAERLTGYLEACAVSARPLTSTLRLRQQNGSTQVLCQGRGVDGDDLWAATHDLGAPILLRCLPSPGLGLDGDLLSDSLERLRQEIGRRHQVETLLSSSVAHAQAVLDTAVDAIITIDQHGIVQSFNRAAERMFGYSAAEVIGNKVNLLMPSPYRDQHDDYLAHYLSTGEKRIIGIGREVQAKRRDGEVFPIELAVSEVRFGKMLHFTGIVRDITERKRAERRLRQREEEARQQRERLVHVGRLSTMGELSAGIAHEINQPLTAIAAYANACQRLLTLDGGDTAEVLATLDKIGKQALRAGQVIQRLRGMIRRRDSCREACELNRLIQDTLVLSEADARLHAFTLAVDLVEQSLPVVVDPIQIQQVLLNLIRNGIDAMLEAAVSDGEIRVQTRRLNDDFVEVRVRDQGVGIPDELRKQLFNPFFTTKAQGIGLGLSISRSIITSHGGRLICQANPDRGVSMVFTLPLALETMHAD